MSGQTIPLLATVRDRITGLEGTAIARAEYAYDTPNIQLAYADNHGVPATIWLSEARLDTVALPVGHGGGVQIDNSTQTGFAPTRHRFGR